MTSPRLKRDAAQHMHPSLALTKMPVQIRATQSEASRSVLRRSREQGGGR
jgi:hypothetical protein